MSLLRTGVCLSLVLVLQVMANADDLPAFRRVAPKSAIEEAATFHTQDGFHMDLLAAEPLVASPVAMAYDENGLAYVCEMLDYPYTDKATHQPYKENTTDKPIGRIRVLQSTRGDGVFDKSWILADGLSWPTGVACYKGGVYVMATPDLWYFKATHLGQPADIRRKVAAGFRKFNIQAVANNLQWGLDNNIYGAGGSNGGEINLVAHPLPKTLRLSHNDFRFDPRAENFEPIPGGARFGNTFDDWGNRFVCNIRNPAQHVVFESQYLSRNPYLPVASAINDVAESGDAIPVYRTSPLEEWRDLRGRRWATDGTVMPRSELVAGGVVTSSSGVTIYRGSAYPPEFHSQFFLAEPANNLIHRQQMVAAAVSFTSHRIESQSDFVSSSDIWCRPVNFTNAPDGTLHVIDMYREVIEHPWSIPDDIRDKLDLESGRYSGRIWRLAPKGFQTPKPPALGGATTAELVALLAHPNGWHRDTAQRLLVERADPAAAALISDLLKTTASSLGRLHALWTLEGLGALTPEQILTAFDDENPHLREHAIKLAERHLKQAPALVDRLMDLARDADMRVRFQAALTLGETADPRMPRALSKIMRRDVADAWVTTAALSSAMNCSHELLQVALSDKEFAATPQGIDVCRRLGLILGTRDKSDELSTAIEALHDYATQQAACMSAAAGLGEGLKRNHKTLADARSPGADTLKHLLQEAYRQAAAADLPTPQRVAAARLVGLDAVAQSEPALAALLDARQPQEVQLAAVGALSQMNDPSIGPLFMSHFSAYSPLVRSEAITAMFTYANRIPALLDAVEAQKVAVRDVPGSRRLALTHSLDPALRARAEKLFAGNAAASRTDAIARYMPAARLKGDSAAGHKIYAAICINCHRLGNEGNDVGPNLATVRNWSPEQIIVNVIDPNREVAPAFVEYIVETTDGETLNGIISDETASSVTLKWAGGQSRTLSRQQIKRIAATRLSLMPEGLEGSFTVQQLADLIALIRGEK